MSPARYFAPSGIIWSGHDVEYAIEKDDWERDRSCISTSGGGYRNLQPADAVGLVLFDYA